MKLFLSSQGIPEVLRRHFLSLFDKGPVDVRMAFIPTAAETYSDEEKEGWYAEGRDDAVLAGVSIEELDLRHYDGDPDRLAADLAGFDGAWVSGGNVAQLRYGMRRSGFDRAILPLLERDFVYAGYSAGSMVVGRDLGTYYDGDLEEPAPPELVREGIGLIGASVIPHWLNGDPERERIDGGIKAAYEAKGERVVTLTDAQAIVMDGGGWEVRG